MVWNLEYWISEIHHGEEAGIGNSMEIIFKNENDPNSILTKGRFSADSAETYMGHFYS